MDTTRTNRDGQTQIGNPLPRLNPPRLLGFDDLVPALTFAILTNLCAPFLKHSCNAWDVLTKLKFQSHGLKGDNFRQPIF